MRRLPYDINIHTHDIAPRRDAVVCFDPVDLDGDAIPDGYGPVSVGIHPWNAESADDDVWNALETALDNDVRIVAVGEIGIDRLRGPSIDVQKEVFVRQARMAAARDLPVVIHCVRAVDIVLSLHKQLRPENQWIIHGFRGNATTARQLLEAGIDLSYGHRYNTEAYAATPANRRYFETD